MSAGERSSPTTAWSRGVLLMKVLSRRRSTWNAPVPSIFCPRKVITRPLVPSRMRRSRLVRKPDSTVCRRTLSRPPERAVAGSTMRAA